MQYNTLDAFLILKQLEDVALEQIIKSIRIESSIFNRWWVYLSEVFLPFSRLLTVILMYLAMHGMFQSTVNDHPIIITLDMIPGVLTIFLLLLYWRIADEFKDHEVDKKFFPDRPIPSGRISILDLRILLGIITTIFIVTNLVWNLVLGWFAILFVFTVLIHFWFFLEELISSNRLLAFITHSPFSLLTNF